MTSGNSERIEIVLKLEQLIAIKNCFTQDQLDGFDHHPFQLDGFVLSFSRSRLTAVRQSILDNKMDLHFSECTQKDLGSILVRLDAIDCHGRVICPNSKAHCRFGTVAHVAQHWEVDPYGNFVSNIETTEVVASPNADNLWHCLECGAEAITEGFAAASC